MANYRARPPSPAAFSSGLVLTGEFKLVVGEQTLVVPHTVERVLAFLALAGHAVNRTKLAGTLWLDATEEQAANNLRTALWRLRRAGSQLIAVHPDRVRLAPEVTVDLAALSDLAYRLIRHPEPEDLYRLPELVHCGELLPDWDDGWVVADRERFRLLRLEALECAAAVLIEQRRFGDALIAALAATRAEPLRESARQLVMQVHACKGNAVEALRAYRAYQSLLRAELGLDPSPSMRRMVAPLSPPQR
jgi:DNA-binding SARP family transcriptional activator